MCGPIRMSSGPAQTPLSKTLASERWLLNVGFRGRVSCPRSLETFLQDARLHRLTLSRLTPASSPDTGTRRCITGGAIRIAHRSARTGWRWRVVPHRECPPSRFAHLPPQLCSWAAPTDHRCSLDPTLPVPSPEISRRRQLSHVLPARHRPALGHVLLRRSECTASRAPRQRCRSRSRLGPVLDTQDRDLTSRSWSQSGWKGSGCRSVRYRGGAYALFGQSMLAPRTTMPCVPVASRRLTSSVPSLPAVLAQNCDAIDHGRFRTLDVPMGLGRARERACSRRARASPPSSTSGTRDRLWRSVAGCGSSGLGC